MAAIEFTLNNLTVNVSGVNGYVDVGTYINLDPVDYIFEARHTKSNSTLIYTFHANTAASSSIDGFKRYKTDEMTFKFLGAIPPAA